MSSTHPKAEVGHYVAFVTRLGVWNLSCFQGLLNTTRIIVPTNDDRFAQESQVLH